MPDFGFATAGNPLPPFTDWTIDSETSELLVGLVRKRRPNHVLECGSGISTLLIAYAMLEYRGEGQHFALDHSRRYAEKTQDLLAMHEMGRPNVCYAPLKGEPPWYDMGKLPIGYKFGEWKFDLVFIDGPPGADTSQARKPALYKLWPMLADDAVILMDDAFRQDEIDACEAWGRDFDIDMEVAPTPRGAAIIRRRVPVTEKNEETYAL